MKVAKTHHCIVLKNNFWIEAASFIGAGKVYKVSKLEVQNSISGDLDASLDEG